MYPIDEDDPVKKIILIVSVTLVLLVTLWYAYGYARDLPLKTSDPEAWSKKHFYQELNRTTVIKLNDHEYVFSLPVSRYCILTSCHDNEGEIRDELVDFAKDFAYYNSLSIVNMTFLESGQLYVKYSPMTSTLSPNEVVE